MLGSLTGRSAVPSIPRKRQTGQDHSASENCLQTTIGSRLHSEILQGSAFYLLSPALNAETCSAEEASQGSFQVSSKF